MIALAGLVYAIQEAARPAPMPLAILLALLAAAAGSVTFVGRQRRQAYPLIDFSLFGNRSLLTGVIAAALAMAATAGTDLLLTQRLQLVLGLTPLHAGLIVTAFAIGSLPVGVLAGGLVHRTGARPLIGGGLLLGALGRPSHPAADPGRGPPARRRPQPGMGRAGPGPGRRGPGHRHGRRLRRDHQRRPAAARRHGLLHRVGLLRTRQPRRPGAVCAPEDGQLERA